MSINNRAKGKITGGVLEVGELTVALFLGTLVVQATPPVDTSAVASATQSATEDASTSDLELTAIHSPASGTLSGAGNTTV